MIKIEFRNKKAQISDTLTWIVATLIIFFIMFFFVAIISLWAAKEKITFSKLSVEKEKIQPHSDFILTENLIYFLNTPIKEGKMLDVILSSLDILIDRNVYLEEIDYANLDPETKYLVDLKKQELIFETKEQLDKMCSEYMLKVPQGVIMKDRKDFVSESEFESGGWKEKLIAEWTDWSILKIPYRGRVIEIKYRQLEKC